MNMRMRMFSLLALLLASLLGAERGQAQMTQMEIIEALGSADPLMRVSAIAATRQLGPQNAGPALRSALIASLEREGPTETAEYALLLADMAGVVSKLEDARAIRPLAGALGTGASIRGLAVFGEPAVAATIEAAKSDRGTGVVQDALVALRFIAEGVGKAPLSENTRQKLVELASQRLEPVQRLTVLWRAIDLAVALDDPGLRAIVEKIASDPSEVTARVDVTDQDGIQRTIELARARLAGDPPLPRW